jgi:hypothetical protein
MWSKILSSWEKGQNLESDGRIIGLIHKYGYYLELSELCQRFGGTNGNTPKAIAAAFRSFDGRFMMPQEKIEEILRSVKKGLLPC